ncbi:MAG: hypothetical protein HW412_253, partial [Bacteroidetes bacterium]|nr:hypothetical protein [Bacteroidota bacterium]
CFSNSWGGLEIQALEVTSKLQERGHRMWLACCHGSRLAEEAHRHNINTIPFNVRGYVHPQIVWQLSRLIKRHGIHIIHCQLSKDIATIVPAMKLSGRRVPILLSKRVGSYVSKKDLLHQLTYAHVSKVLAVSEVIHKNVLETTPVTSDRVMTLHDAIDEVIHKNVLETTPVTSDRVMTLHDAIDTSLFSPHRIDRQKVRGEFGFSNDMIVIGFVGRFSPGKGHEELLGAAGILSKKYKNIHFLVVGEASHGEHRYEQKVRTLSLSLGLQNIITFTGFRKDIPEVMAAFDIFAFPSHAESFGIVLIEAMAMERPVVSTNCDGVLDIVVDRETGLYVHPRNGKELAEALARLIEDSSLREKMGKAGRKRVEELFDQRKQLNKLEGMYYELVEKEAVGV